MEKTIRLMVVPGKIARVVLTSLFTVLEACRKASEQHPEIDWQGLARDREVRVQNRKFSNTDTLVDGTFGSIHTTELADGDVVLILTKIKGNDPIADPVLTCFVGEQEFALETPIEVGVVLDLAGYNNPEQIDHIEINGEVAEASRLVGNGDQIRVIWREVEELDRSEDLSEEYEPEESVIESSPDDKITIEVNGKTISGRPEDLKRLLGI